MKFVSILYFNRNYDFFVHDASKFNCPKDPWPLIILWKLKKKIPDTVITTGKPRYDCSKTMYFKRNFPLNTITCIQYPCNHNTNVLAQKAPKLLIFFYSKKIAKNCKFSKKIIFLIEKTSYYCPKMLLM